MVLSLDGLFGLPRRKAAGVSHRDALHGDVFFCEQTAVDEFVKDSTVVKVNSKVYMCQFVLVVSLIVFNTLTGM